MDDDELHQKLKRIDEIKTELTTVAAPAVKRQGWSRVRKWGAEIALVVGLTALLYAGIANNAAHIASQRAQAACEQDFYVAQSPAILPSANSPGTSTLGYHLIVSDRLAYYTAQCHLGPLAPTDPVVRAWMVANRGDNLVQKFLQLRPDGN